MDLTSVLQLTLSGITNGAVYALIALGFTVTFNASRVANFAQGSFVTLGGLMAVSLLTLGVPLWVAAGGGVLATAAIAAALYIVTVARVPASDAFGRIMVTLGLAVALEAAMQLTWGTQARRLPAFSGEEPLGVLGATITPQALWVIAGSALITVVLFVFFRSTRLGQGMLATSEDREGAALLGIGVNRMAAAAFVLGAGLAAAVGVLITPMTTALYSHGIAFTVKGFAASVLGGFGNPVGAVVGGLTLGLVESYTVGIVPSGYSELVPLLVLIAFLMVRPQGLVGSRVFA